MVDVQKELEKELDRLRKKWGRGKELNVVWMPPKNSKYKTTVSYGKTYELCGEVDKTSKTIYIYTKELEDSLHTLRHEFFEYILDMELISDYVNMYNYMRLGFEKAFMESAYSRKEALIEALVKREEEILAIERNSKNN